MLLSRDHLHPINLTYCHMTSHQLNVKRELVSLNKYSCAIIEQYAWHYFEKCQVLISDNSKHHMAKPLCACNIITIINMVSI